LDRRKFLETGLALAGAVAVPGAGPKPAARELSLSEAEKKQLLLETRRIFSGSRAEIKGKFFHYPSAGNYHSFFAWDSGTNVVINKYFSVEESFNELETIYSFQEPDGRIPHEVRLEGMKEKDPMRNVTIALLKSQFDDRGVSALIDPPNFIFALWDLFQFGNDQRVPALAEKAQKCADYLLSGRDLFGDGLVSIIHPWESGTDASPVFDETIGVNFKSPTASVEYLNRYVKLLNELAKINFDPKKCAEQNIFVFEDTGYNAWTALGLVGLSRLYEKTGDQAGAKKFLDKAKNMVAAMEKIFWDDKQGFFYPRWDRKNPKLSMRKTASGILPLMTGLVSEDKAHRLIEHLKRPDEFWTPYPVSFNAESELKNENLAFESKLLWRGHCIWSNINWGIALALEQYGEKQLAKELTLRFAKMILASGFREFYDTRTGKGQGAQNFTWPGLVNDLIGKFKI